MTTLETAPAVFRPAPARRPLAATVAAAALLLLGSVTSTGGIVFSAAAGGGWLVATPLFAVALVLWWTAGVGILRASWRGHRLGVAMLTALFAFGLMKIFVYHESAAYLFQSLTIVVVALVLAAPTRAWCAGQDAGVNEA
jgi:hypothetical protein